jgi:GTPase SAR1 family protein
MSISLPRKGSMRTRALTSASQKIAGTMRLKLLLVGDSNTGKSSLLRRYNADTLAASKYPVAVSGSKFDLSASTPTVGVDFISASIVGTRPGEGSAAAGRSLRVQANFFDLSGDPLYMKVRSEFYTDQHGVIFTFDLTNRSSWDHIESIWWSEVTNRAPPEGGGPIPPPAQIHAIVIGCKSDLIEGNRESARAISDRDVKQWCKMRGASYFECSAKNGNGVIKAIDYLLEHAQADVRIQGSPSSSPPSVSASGTASASPPPSSSPTPSPPFSSAQQRPPSASPHHSPSNSFGGSSTSSANISEMSLTDLRRECTKRGIDTSNCLEKNDVLMKLREALAKERSAKEDALSESKIKDERARENVLSDVNRWARGKDIRSMLNEIHGWTDVGGKDSQYLQNLASFAPVASAYKKALLKIHPDKVDSHRDPLGHLRATEMFKLVNAAFELFKKMNEKRTSNGTDVMAAAAAAAAAPAPSTSPTPRQRQTRRS